MKSDKTNLFNILYERFSKYQIGILLMVASSLSLSLMAVLIKFLKNYPLMEISLFRSLPAVITITVILKQRIINYFGNNKILLTVCCFFWDCQLSGIFLYMQNDDSDRCNGNTSTYANFCIFLIDTSTKRVFY